MPVKSGIHEFNPWIQMILETLFQWFNYSYIGELYFIETKIKNFSHVVFFSVT